MSGFSDNERRTLNWAELKPLLEAVIQQQKVEYWLERLEKENIPCGRIQDVDQVIQDPQIVARDMIRTLVLRTGEKLSVAGIPL
jgi:crotonobetainyl-CoA:carnitine CoA-transferase CaiB-like acyl-CoA transferase